ncbi:MAG: exodeoxyribonuclease VII small subunit [Proteiniphilum sp.]|nr:exodeoxyribonuclease VII small subunit [Proteiniphilum sp.]
MEKMTYTEAKKELEQIVSAIETGELDVDALTYKVKRASVLIAFCKEKLTKTDKELRKILDDIS